MKISTIKINDDTFQCHICETQEESSLGMMGKRFNDSFNCMVFPLPEKYGSFWMKDCLIPLDIIYVNNNKISKIHHNCPPCSDDNCKRYYGSGDFVIELEGGSCSQNLIYEGDDVIFN